MGCCTDKERISFLVPKSQCFPQTHKAHPQEQMSRLCLCCQGNQSVLSSRIRKPGPGLSSAFCSLLNRARHLFPTGDTKDHVTKSLALASGAGAPSTAHTSLAHTNKSMAGGGGLGGMSSSTPKRTGQLTRDKRLTHVTGNGIGKED